MRHAVHVLPLVAIGWAMPAYAGDEPLYEATPDWVIPSDIASVLSDDGPAERLWEWQYRLEDGVVHAFTDRAIRVDNPQALMSINQQSLAWLPDKGDLIVHRLEIYRDGEVIDLVEDGARFEVLRREQGLEQRLLDGEFTATLSVPGLREGDTLRIAHTVTTADQALGDEVQALQMLFSEPWQVGHSRAVFSWPADEEMFWRVEDKVELAEPTMRDGYSFLEVEMPLAEPDPVPYDAPYRYRRPSILRVGSFADWAELSRVMTPHFESAATVAPDSEVAALARNIMAETDDPIERTARAVRLVQDEVSYLLNGLDGGNYLPQAAEETWDVRYGDCKAKSVLLLALLRHMDIESEVVLVSSGGGDAVAELLPLPAAFDHMIVHAVIDGVDYWLDGTSTGSRVSNLDLVPAFYHALPLREGGADLMPMTQRPLAQPQFTMTATADHSAGIDFPTLSSMDIEIIGAGAAQIQAMVDEGNPAMLRQMAAQMGGSGSGMIVSAIELDYDSDDARATVHLEGIGQPVFEWSEGRLRAQFDSPANASGFNPDRARSAWRDIPVATMGPVRQRFVASMVLPEDGEGYALEGTTEIDGGYGNVAIASTTAIVDGAVRTEVELSMLAGEIAAADLPEAKRAARRLEAQTVELVPPENVTWRWELTDAERERRAAPILAAYDQAIDFAEEDDFGPLQWRAAFLVDIYRYEDALADFDTLADEDPSVWVYSQRSSIHRSLGNDEAAIADMQSAFDLDPSNEAGRELAELMALSGRADEARDLLEMLPVGEDDRIPQANALATVTALAGDVAAGHDVLAEALATQPQNAYALNGDCWFRGLNAYALDDALGLCTQAVERAGNPSFALDSRALVHFRQGDLTAALADLDAVLDLVPGMAPSLYLRGIVRLHAGDGDGSDDIEEAVRMVPYLPGYYAQYGITPPR